jgi:hypothetical protein
MDEVEQHRTFAGTFTYRRARRCLLVQPPRGPSQSPAMPLLGTGHDSDRSVVRNHALS